jgi:hypothetical protein
MSCVFVVVVSILGVNAHASHLSYIEGTYTYGVLLLMQGTFSLEASRDRHPSLSTRHTIISKRCRRYSSTLVEQPIPSCR